MLQPDGRVTNLSSYSENQTSFRHILVADTAVWVVPQTGMDRFSDHNKCSPIQSKWIDILEFSHVTLKPNLQNYHEASFLECLLQEGFVTKS